MTNEPVLCQACALRELLPKQDGIRRDTRRHQVLRVIRHLLNSSTLDMAKFRYALKSVV